MATQTEYEVFGGQLGHIPVYDDDNAPNGKWHIDPKTEKQLVFNNGQRLFRTSKQTNGNGYVEVYATLASPYCWVEASHLRIVADEPVPSKLRRSRLVKVEYLPEGQIYTWEDLD